MMTISTTIETTVGNQMSIFRIISFTSLRFLTWGENGSGATAGTYALDLMIMGINGIVNHYLYILHNFGHKATGYPLSTVNWPLPLTGMAARTLERKEVRS